MWVVIPSFEPDARLPELVARLTPWARVVVIDDGSGDRYARFFAASGALGATILTHRSNHGKAAALRTAFAWLAEHGTTEVVVCADGDGQHPAPDIRRVADEALRRHSRGEADGIVLGSRAFTGPVPLRSRLGNRITTLLVASVTGRRLVDTQTGLRAFAPGLLPWLLAVRGERFAYELRMLLDASREGVAIHEVRIATVYTERNESSHFRPIVDSWRVMLPVLLFAGSSLIAFGVDTFALLGLAAVTGNLAVSIAGARLLSGTVNFTLNRRTVFRASGALGPQVARYVALAAALLVLSYAGLWALTSLGVPLLLAKVLTDLALFGVSYAVQRAHIFAGRHAKPSVEWGECQLSPRESTPTTLR